MAISFTPYGWTTSINGNATARGHTVDIDESFIEIVEKSDSLMALMGYFEARKGPFALFTDVVWEDLTFDGQRSFDVNRNVSGNPFARLADFNVTIKGNLDIKGNAQVDYQSTIIQSGAAYEVAKWGSGPTSYTALDVLGGARYWNQEVDISLRVAGTLTADVQADFKRLGLSVRRSVKRSAATAIARSVTSNGSIRSWEDVSGIDRPRQGAYARRRCRWLRRWQRLLLASGRNLRL